MISSSRDQGRRNGLLVDFRVAEANGRAEREVALAMLDEHKTVRGPATVGADKGYDTHDFVAECRSMTSCRTLRS